MKTHSNFNSIFQEAVRLFGKHGIIYSCDGKGFIDGVRCSCNMKLCTDWTLYKFNRHFKSSKHLQAESKWDKEGIQQVVMESLAAEEAEKEAERLRKKKTRATKSVNHDDSFRKKTTAAFLIWTN